MRAKRGEGGGGWGLVGCCCGCRISRAIISLLAAGRSPPMSKFGKSANLHRDPFKLLRRCASVAALVTSVAAFAIGTPALAQASDKIPDLASAQFAWLALGVDWLDPPPGLGRGPIRPDSAHPYHGNRDGPGQVTPHIGNTNDPGLKPWAAEQMQDSNEEVLSGKLGLPFSAQSMCLPV